MAPLLIPSTYEVEWSMGVVAPTFACCQWCSNYYTLWGWATKTHQSLQRCLQGLRSSCQRLGQDVISPPDIKIFDQQLEVVHDLIDLRSSIRQTVSHSIVSWTREWAIQHALYSFQGYSRHLFSLAYSSEKCSTQRSICCAPLPGLPLLLLDPLPLYVAWTILNSTLWIPDSSWWILDSLLVKLVSPIPIVNGIPGSLNWIADSKAQDSRINKKTFPRFSAGNRVTLHGAIVIVQ